MTRGQTAFEYLLILGGSVLLSAVVLVFVHGNLGQVAPGITVNKLSSGIGGSRTDCAAVFVNEGQPKSITQAMLADDIIIGGSSTWTQNGTDQYSSLSGNVGIGTNNPTSKLTVNGTIDVSNNTITGLSAPMTDTDAANKGYVDAAGSGLDNATVSINSTVNIGMPLQGVLNYDATITGYPVNTIPISLPKSNCGVKITACNTAPTKLIIGADPVTRIIVANIHHSPINEVSPTYLSAVAASTDSGSVSCGIWHYEPMPGRLCSCEGSIAQYCAANYVCVYPGSCSVSNSYDCYGGASRGGCCPAGKTYDSGNGVCYTCPAGYTWDAASRVCYTGANTAANRCPAAGSGEVLLRWINTVSSRTCVYYNSVAYTNTSQKFIIEESDNYIYCPTDHPTYDPISKNCIKDATVSTNLIGTRCSTFSTYLTTAFTDITFRNDAGSYVDAYSVKVAYNCPQD